MKRTLFNAGLKPGSVDAEKGIIYGVAVVSEGPAKGHGVFADARTLATVAQCSQRYESGVRVVADHEGGILDTLGALKEFRTDGATLRADFHLLTADASARAKILEMAQTMPDTFGLSITFDGAPETINGLQFARCTNLVEVALVKEPAANPSLFQKMENVAEIVSDAVAEALKPMAEEIAAFKDNLTALESGRAPVAKEEVTAMSAQISALRTELAATKTDAITALASKLGVQDAKADRWSVSPAAPANGNEGKYEPLRTAFAAARKEGKSEPRAAFAARTANPKLYDEFLAEHRGDLAKLK